MPLSDSDRQLIRRILRVNHAGEHGAVAIYGAQIRRASGHHPDLLDWLNETIGHEKDHREKFLAAMPTRAAKPCRALYVWKAGGAVLGTLTAWMGKNGIMACTAAVERTVHRHLDEQIAFLKTRDTDLAHIIAAVQVEEEAHLSFADANHNNQHLLARGLALLIGAATELLIAISTRGDSLLLPRRLRAAGPHH